MPRRALALVDLGAVEANARTLCAHMGTGTELGAVVKADGYGHGAVPVARAALAGGASWLFVAAAEEAAELRADGLEDAPIVVMGALERAELATAAAARADVVAWHEDWVDALPPGTRVHVKLDTGMGRLGTRDPAEADRVAERVAARKDLALVGAMTHFATADDPEDGGFLTHQLGTFLAWAEPLRDRHPGIVLHAANSAGTLREPRAHLDLVRCGIALYGLDPFGEDARAQGLVPALELRSWVAAVKPAAPGDTTGYGRTWRASRPTRIATLPIGYGDGLRRAFSDDLDVLIRGRRFPLVGTVSMDNITVDVGDAGVEAGDEAVLIGGGLTAEELAKRIGTINYEITCGISARVPRAYR